MKNGRDKYDPRSPADESWTVPEEERLEAREGTFDSQLMFPTPFVEAPPPVASIIKRDGREVPFDRNNIVEAIYRAAQSAGVEDRDRAAGLAQGVTLYLSKEMNGRPPTVDQVDEAVERVLFEIGDAATAVAYVRYRDRRARLRRLREGDTRVVLDEWAQALRERDEQAAPARPSLFVRTSDETVTTWDRERIVDALVRETGLDRTAAEMIAIEVEEQIMAAQVKTLTSALVRELVSAKLIEHGFEAYHRRHMRLGVPLYDAGRIVCGPHPDSRTHPTDPEATGRLLAESVKREFALSQVFTDDVAEVHLRGDVHIHGLGRVDRLHRSIQSLEYVARFGVGLPDSRSFSRPPKYPDTLLAQMVNSSATLQNHFASTIGWDALNVFFAPFLQGHDKRAMHQVAQMLVYEYAYRAVIQGESGPSTEIILCWEVPDYLKYVEAVGPGGEPTGAMYAEYEHTAQEFVWALFDVFQEGGARGQPFPAPAPVVRMAADFFKAPGHEGFLAHVAEVAALRGNVHVVFDRENQPPTSLHAWEPHENIVQRVTLNLPRMAYRAKTEHDLMREIERLVGVAAQAHIQKRSFIVKLLALKELGPLGLLAVERNGRPYLDLDHARYVVGLTGLNECVQHFTGKALHESPEAVAFAQRLIAFVKDLCDRWSEDVPEVHCVLAQTDDLGVSRRFAALDLQAFVEQARQTVKADPSGQDICYTRGIQLAEEAGIIPMERARLEGELHGNVRFDAFSRIRMPETDTSARSIADFLQKAYHLTQCHAVALEG